MGLKPLLFFNFREEKFAGGKFREIPFAVDIIFAGGKFRAKSKFAKIAKINSTRKIGVIQYITLYQLAPVVSDCVEKKEIFQRTTHSSRCLVVFSSARIPWSVRCSVQLIQDIRDRSTILLIRSFSRQLSSESTILRHIDENRPHQRALYFSSLLIPRSLQIGIRDRAFFAWQFQFWI